MYVCCTRTVVGVSRGVERVWGLGFFFCTVVGVSRGMENHILDETIFCVQVRAAATAL